MLRMTFIFMGLATPALAHEGFHFNPHGGEVLLGLIALGAGLWLWVRR
jgi:hypothetical protein